MVELKTWFEQGNQLARHLQSGKLLLSEDSIDHIGIKTASLPEYEKCKSYLSSLGECLGEVTINGRPISTFKLSEAQSILNQDVSLVELAAPKANENKSGFDHVEIVIQESFADRKARFSKGEWSPVRWPTIINPELVLTLPEGVAKFHFMSLEDVIHLEHTHADILTKRVAEPQKLSDQLFPLDAFAAKQFLNSFVMYD